MKILIFILFLLTISSQAHPHTFIEVKPSIQVIKKQINKLSIKWVLDEMTSMMLIMELDNNANGKFEKDENTYIYENYFASLKKYNFYMEIDSKNKNLQVSPKNFKASIEKNQLVYSFDIEEKLDLKDLKINFYDEELFVGLILEKKYIEVLGLDKKYANNIKKNVFGVK